MLGLSSFSVVAMRDAGYPLLFSDWLLHWTAAANQREVRFNDDKEILTGISPGFM